MYINPRTSAQASILSFYKYNDKLFDKWIVPNGIDKDLAVNLILQETANLESFYSNWDYLNFAIGVWGKKMFWTFNKLYETLEFDYNPIWNKDGIITEERSIDETTTNENVHAGTTHGETDIETSRSGNTKTSEGTENTRTGTAEENSDGTTYTRNGIAGFNNASGFVNDTDTEVTNNGENRTANTEAETGSRTAETSDTGTEKGRNTGRTAETSTDNGTGTRGMNEAYKRVEQGNIGLTSTQQLITEERNVSMFELYSYIVNSFKKNFCIMVY